MDRDTAVRALFKSGAAVLVGTVFEVGFSFLGKVFIARYLTRTDYGSVAIGVSVLTFVASLSILGLAEGLARYVPRYDDPGRQRAVMIAGFLLGMPLPTLLGVLMVVRPAIVAEGLLNAPEATPLFPVFGAALPVTAFVYLAGGATRGLQWSVPRIVIQHFALPLSRFGFIVTAILLGAGAYGMAGAYALPFVVAGLFSAYFLWQTPLVGGPRESPDVYRELIRFSLPLALTAVTAKVLADMDLYLLSYFQQTGDVAVYDIVYSMGKLITVGLGALGFLFMPLLSELHAEERYDDMRRMFKIGSKWITMLTLPVALIMGLFPEMTIKLTFGTEYTAGAGTLSILAIGFFLDSTLGTNAGVLQSIGRTRFIAVVNGAAAALNVALNLVLIPRFSTVGAAIATTVALAFMNAVFTAELYRDLGMHPFSAAMVRPAAIAIALVGVIYLVITRFLGITPVTVVAMGAVFAVVYGFAVLRFGGIEREEVMILNSAEDRFGVDLEPVKRILRSLLPE